MHTVRHYLYVIFYVFTISSCYCDDISKVRNETISNGITCTISPSIEYSLIQCEDIFQVNFTYSEYTAEEITFICLKKTDFVVPSNIFELYGRNFTSPWLNIFIRNCNISAQFLKEIQSAMTKFPQVRSGDCTVYIYGNEKSVIHIDKETFEDLIRCQNLNISHPFIQLSNKYYFQEDLQKLSLRNSNISTIPEGIFNQTLNLSSLQLENNELVDIPQNIFQNVSKLRFLFLGMNALSILKHSWFLTLPKLLNLKLDNNNISELPARIFSPLSSLKFLDASYNPITYIHEEAFKGVTKLNYIILDSCKLLTLESVALREIPSLRYFSVTHNSLTTLENVTFPSHLLLLRLSHNNLGQWITNTSVSMQIPYLVNVELIDCGITKAYLAFLKRANIVRLNLEYNNITEIPIMFLPFSRSLTVLRLDYNNISKIYPLAFRDKKLVTLSLNNNNLNIIGQFVFRDLTELQYLFLRTNGITFIDRDAFRGVTNLLVLDLSHNKISTVSLFTYRPINSLLVLDLSHNNISISDLEFASYLNNLEELYLSFNSIRTISWIQGFNLPKLKVLYLDDNQLVEFTVARHDDKSISVINLANNQLQGKLGTNDTDFTSMPSLQYVDLSNNSYTNIRINWRNLKYLNVLNISYNNILHLTSNDFLYSSPELLVDLSYNNITSIAFEDREIEPVVITSSAKVYLDMNSRSMECDCYVFNVLKFHQSDVTLRHEEANVANISQSTLACQNPISVQEQDFDHLEDWTLEMLTLLGLCVL